MPHIGSLGLMWALWILASVGTTRFHYNLSLSICLAWGTPVCNVQSLKCCCAIAVLPKQTTRQCDTYNGLVWFILDLNTEANIRFCPCVKEQWSPVSMMNNTKSKTTGQDYRAWFLNLSTTDLWAMLFFVLETVHCSVFASIHALCQWSYPLPQLWQLADQTLYMIQLQVGLARISWPPELCVKLLTVTCLLHLRSRLRPHVPNQPQRVIILHFLTSFLCFCFFPFLYVSPLQTLGLSPSHISQGCL